MSTMINIYILIAEINTPTMRRTIQKILEYLLFCLCVIQRKIQKLRSSVLEGSNDISGVGAFPRSFNHKGLFFKTCLLLLIKSGRVRV